MKLFLKKIGLFIPFFLTIHCICILTLTSLDVENLNLFKKEKGHMFNRLEEIENFKQTDILFLGSSHAYRGFDVKLFEKQGFNAFNLGSSNQSLVQSYILLKNYINYINPKFVIIEINPLSFCYNGDESNLDILINTQKNSIEKDILLNSPNLTNINTLIYKYIFNTIVNDSCTYQNKNYYKGYIRTNSVFNLPLQKVTNFQKTLKEKQLRYLNKILSLLSKNNVTYMFVHAPVTKNFIKYYGNFPIDSILSNKNYINFRTLKNMNDSLNFYDSHHMNQSGVNIFNKALLDTLRRSNFLNY